MFKGEKRHKNETNKNWEWKEEDVSTCIRPKTLFSWSICRKCQPTKLSLELRTVALTLTLLNFSKDFLKHARPREEVFYSWICCNFWQFYQLFLRKASEIAYARIFTYLLMAIKKMCCLLFQLIKIKLNIIYNKITPEHSNLRLRCCWLRESNYHV